MNLKMIDALHVRPNPLVPCLENGQRGGNQGLRLEALPNHTATSGSDREVWTPRPTRIRPRSGHEPTCAPSKNSTMILLDQVDLTPSAIVRSVTGCAGFAAKRLRPSAQSLLANLANWRAAPSSWRTSVLEASSIKLLPHDFQPTWLALLPTLGRKTLPSTASPWSVLPVAKRKGARPKKGIASRLPWLPLKKNAPKHPTHPWQPHVPVASVVAPLMTRTYWICFDLTIESILRMKSRSGGLPTHIV